jgi:hypothetical protein
MTRHFFTFLATFALGALIALGARTASHQPAATLAAVAPPAKSEISDLKSEIPVNTVCAICGMAVDPKLPTVTYQGKTIGFGCKMCPPKFQAEPDKYGPIYLRNEVIKR